MHRFAGNSLWLASVAFVALGCANGRLPQPREPLGPEPMSDAGAADALGGAAHRSSPDAAADARAVLVVEPSCGDGSCDRASETCRTCEADCGPCPARCGDGTCDRSEDCTSCAADCSCGPRCGDGMCDRASETCDSCSRDCGACPTRCGDRTCDPSETCATCAADCGACAGGGGGDPCTLHASCGACVDDSGCGYCDGACVSGSITGPSGPRSCGTWLWFSFSC
ncbi:MAG: hypothetical protein ACK6CU_25435 [Deltaproteobacteria bacterium]